MAITVPRLRADARGRDGGVLLNLSQTIVVRVTLGATKVLLDEIG
jgi:hypothetical protein